MSDRTFTRIAFFLFALLISGVLTVLVGGGEVAMAVSPPAGYHTRDFSLPIPLFAADSAWRQMATAAKVLSNSDRQILATYRVLRGDTADQRPLDNPPTTNWPFMDVGYDDFTVPIFRAGEGRQEVLICDYEGNLSWPSPKFDIDRQGGPVPVPAPVGTVRPSGPQDTGADGHLVLYDTATFE